MVKRNFIFLFVVVSLILLSVYVYSAAIQDQDFFSSAGTSEACGGDCLQCSDISFSGTRPSSYATNDCWEYWFLYCKTCSKVGSVWFNDIDSQGWMNFTWGDDGRIADISSLGGVAFSAEFDCYNECDPGWDYCFLTQTGVSGYCGLAARSSSFTAVGNLKDIGSPSGTETLSSSISITNKAEEWDDYSSMPLNTSPYRFGYFVDGFDVAQIFSPTGYFSAHQFKMFTKGVIAYPNNYTGHQVTWGNTCDYPYCAVTSDWDNLDNQGTNVNVAFTDNACTLSCGGKSISSLQSSMLQGYMVMAQMTGDDLELTSPTGMSTGYGDPSEYNTVITIVGYNDSGYFVDHPYNQRQFFSNAEFANWYNGYACIETCDFSSIISASDPTPFAYDFVNLTSSADYETGGAYAPTITCWDDNDNGITDYCYCKDNGEGGCLYSCTICPESGIEEDIGLDWNEPRSFQKNNSGTEFITINVASVDNSGDRGILFDSDDITIQWLAPTITPYISYAAGCYDSDCNDDGIVVKTYTIGFNISKSNSNGDNDYVKIWGAIWNITQITGEGEITIEGPYCRTNYSDTNLGEHVDPADWCLSQGVLLYDDVEWNTIYNFSISYAGNFVARVKLLTINAGPPSGVGWTASESIEFFTADPVLVPRFHNITINNATITDWSPPLSIPIVFDMDDSGFNEDYIDWIVVDVGSDGVGTTDLCYARNNEVDNVPYTLYPELLDGSMCYIPTNLTVANHLEEYPIRLEPPPNSGTSWANVGKNVSVRMGTTLNISSWVKHEFQFQSDTLVADINLIDSDTSSWITDYGDTIWYDMNTSEFGNYGSIFSNLNPLQNITITNPAWYCKCWIGWMLDWFGWIECTSVEQETSIRLWNTTPIAGVCYDYTFDGTFDKCFDSQKVQEIEGSIWVSSGGFSMSSVCDNIACDYASYPEDKNWYLNNSNVGSGENTIEGLICTLYGQCDTFFQNYEFIPPSYYADCRFGGNIQVNSETTDANRHTEQASTYSGTSWNLKITNSSTTNIYYPIRYACVTSWGMNSESVAVIYNQFQEQCDRVAAYLHYLLGWTQLELFASPICPRHYTNSLYITTCYAPNSLDCDCEFFPDDFNSTAIWLNSNSINYIVYITESIIIWVEIGYDSSKRESTVCNMLVSGPDITGCIAPSIYDDDLDDDFKVFINLTTINATIGFDPSCAVVNGRSEIYTGLNFTAPKDITNTTASINSTLINQTNVTLIYNTTALNISGITGVCWDIEDDGNFDYTAGYVSCANSFEGGESYPGQVSNISKLCNVSPSNNLSANWGTILNITRNDTYNTTVTVMFLDKCGASFATASQKAYWDKEGQSSVLCFDGVLDNENFELQTSGDTSISDYGGSCGLCTDGILNNNELETNYQNSGYDYGGKWCGYCGLPTKKDETWLQAMKQYGLTVPFDPIYCKEIEGAATVVIIITIIIIIILFLFLFFILFAIGFSTIILTVNTIRRLMKHAEDSETVRKLARFLQRNRKL